MKTLIILLLIINLLVKRSNYLLFILNIEILLLFIINTIITSSYSINLLAFILILLLFTAIEASLLLYIII